MTTTPNLALNKPAAGDAAWDAPLNANADILDAHDHSGAAGHGLKVAHANLSGLDTDAGPTSLHHTLGTAAGQAAAGNDARLSDARTPTAHHTTHSTGGTDTIAPADIGAATTAALTAHTGNTSNPHAVTAAQAGAEPALGNPTTSGYVLSSTAAGARSWVAPGTGGLTNPMTTQDDLIVGGASGAATRLAKGADGQVLTVDPATHHLVWATNSAANGSPLGLTGATAATRYVGGTASGAPTSGTFAVGDFVIAQSGGVYICTAAGSPGTWAAVSGGGGGSGAVTQIAQVSLAAAAANITFSAIPGTYNALRLVGVARTDNAADVAVNLRCNGDTGANYDWQDQIATGGSTSSSNALAATAINIFAIPGANQTAGIANSFTIDIPAYKQTSFRKGIIGADVDQRSNAAFWIRHVAAVWRSTAAITALTFTPGAGNFLAGTTITLYGIL